MSFDDDAIAAIVKKALDENRCLRSSYHYRGTDVDIMYEALHDDKAHTIRTESCALKRETED